MEKPAGKREAAIIVQRPLQTSRAGRSSNTPMKIVVAGGTGFLGSPLCEAWAEEGHDVRVLTRSLAGGTEPARFGDRCPRHHPGGLESRWHGRRRLTLLESANAVINLAGESIGKGRWTAARRRVLRESRILATRSLARRSRLRHRRHLSSSAAARSATTGHGLTRLTDSSSRRSGFLADLCVEWEAEAHGAPRLDVRVVIAATGIALERSGGSLPQDDQAVPVLRRRTLGSGRQYFSWIHRLDWIEMVRWIVETPDVSGPINATAPDPVTNDN